MAADDRMYFVELVSGTTSRLCWVDRKVRVGSEITLKDSEDPDRRWRVSQRYARSRTTVELGSQRGWHVGGL